MKKKKWVWGNTPIHCALKDEMGHPTRYKTVETRYKNSAYLQFHIKQVLHHPLFLCKTTNQLAFFFFLMGLMGRGTILNLKKPEMSFTKDETKTM